MADHTRDLERIIDALQASAKVYRSRSMESVRVERKTGGDPVTDAEREVNELLFEKLVEPGDGWLSEESADSSDRLTRSRVWLVDPLDGTKEYVSGIPEWSISIALMENGELVSAGVSNPSTNEMIYGSVGKGKVLRTGPVEETGGRKSEDEPLVLGSRSEVKRGEWERFRSAKFRVQPMGSVAYKMALVAAGGADATWTLVPKHEWDVAAGVALVRFAGGSVFGLDGRPPAFNAQNPMFPGLVAFSSHGIRKLRPFLSEILENPSFNDCRRWARAVIDSVANL